MNGGIKLAEITKITTPMLPKENAGNKHRPISDQAFDLTDPSKVHKTDQDSKTADRQQENLTNLMRENMGRAALAPLLKNAGDMAQVFKKIAFLIEMGVSASDVVNDEGSRELLESLFISKEDFPKMLMEQENSSVLFKGDAFNALREILAKFQDYPKVKDAIANLLKVFDQNVGTQNSVKTILNICSNLLDYMFSNDRQQFAGYLRGLAEMLLPPKEAQEFGQRLQEQNTQASAENTQQSAAEPRQPATGGHTPEMRESSSQPQSAQEQQTGTQNRSDAAQQPAGTQNRGDGAQEQQSGTQNRSDAAQQQDGNQNRSDVTQQQQSANQSRGDITQEQANAQNQNPARQAEENIPRSGNEPLPAQNSGNAEHARAQAAEQPPIAPKEMAQVLKNNLLPLLGEIVVKYHQNGNMRDAVMVVVHNIVRVDQGTPESLQEAVSKLVNELKYVANLPQNFEKNLYEALKGDAEQAKNAPNSVISKLSDIVQKALSSPEANPAVVRQAGNMMVSMLQNQSSMMDILHFMLPLQTEQGQIFTELYVDPETDEHVNRRQGKSRKIFLSIESEAHGVFELSFLETDGHVEFAMWCPDNLAASLSGLKRHIADIMQVYGYTMDSCKIEEFREPHSVAEVFPRLLEKKVGVDVRI